MTGSVRVATIQRPSGNELRVIVEPHPHGDGRMTVIEMFRADGTLGPRIVLRPSEIEKVARALNTAAAMLSGAGATNHRTVIAADIARQLEEDRKIF